MLPTPYKLTCRKFYFVFILFTAICISSNAVAQEYSWDFKSDIRKKGIEALSLQDLIGKKFFFVEPNEKFKNDCFYGIDAVTKLSPKKKFLFAVNENSETPRSEIFEHSFVANEIVYLNPAKRENGCFLIMTRDDGVKIALFFDKYKKKKEVEAFSTKGGGFQGNRNLRHKKNPSFSDLYILSKDESISGTQRRYNTITDIFPILVYNVTALDEDLKQLTEQISMEEYYGEIDSVIHDYKVQDIKMRNHKLEVNLLVDNKQLISVNPKDILSLLEKRNKAIKHHNNIRTYANKTSKAFIDSLKKNCVGKVYYLTKERERGNHNYLPIMPYFLNASGSISKNSYEGYEYIIDDINFQEHKYRKGIYGYFALLEYYKEPSKDYLVFPINEYFDKYFVRAEVHREQVKEEELKRLKEKEEDDINYKQYLIKTYGKNNANIILNGEIRLGFTKEMVLESWGNPDNVNSLINQDGKIDCWSYGLITVVYFKGNKVVQIIN